MTKLKKFIVILITLAIATASLTTVAFAETIDKSQKASNILKFNTEVEKEEILSRLLEEDPGALFFYSREEAESFFNSAIIETNVSNEIMNKTSMGNNVMNSSGNVRHFEVEVNFGIIAWHHFHFSYGISTAGSQHGSGTVFTSLANTPYLTQSGFSPGVVTSLAGWTITRTTLTRLDVRYTVQFKYYLIFEGFLEIATSQTTYNVVFTA